MNPDIGTIKCPFGGEVAKVRRAKSGKFPLYFACEHSPQCFMKSSAGQKWITDHMRAFQPAPAPEKKPEPEPEKTPAPAAQPVEEDSGCTII